MDWLPSPDPPSWAVAAGLPEPHVGESFVSYVERLGLDCERLTHGLSEKTAALANLRLSTRIASDMPEAWREYTRARFIAAHEEELHRADRQIERTARLLFAERYQPKKVIREAYERRK